VESIGGGIARYNYGLRTGWPVSRGSIAGRGTNSSFHLVETHSLIQLVPGSLSSGVKRPGRHADQSPPSNVEVKNSGRYTFIFSYVFMAW
jgi:hypothetical protein